MAQRTITQFFPSYAASVQAMADLVAAGIPAADIAVIDNEMDGRLPPAVVADSAQSPAATGATLGATIGGGLGVLDGVGALTLPYTEPLVATGWILPCVLFALVGAAIGAAVGAAFRLGVTNKQAHAWAWRLRNGEHLVMARVDEAAAPQIAALLAQERLPPGRVQVPEPVYDMEPVADHRTVAQEAAAIHQAEATTQYRSE